MANKYHVNRADANHDSTVGQGGGQPRKQPRDATTVIKPYETANRAAMTHEAVKLKLEAEQKWAKAERERLRNAKAPGLEKRKSMDGVDVVTDDIDIPM